MIKLMEVKIRKLKNLLLEKNDILQTLKINNINKVDYKS